MITKKPQAGGLGLIDASAHFRDIWGGLALEMFITHRRSPHAARAAYWAMEPGSEKCVARELLRHMVRRLPVGAKPSQHARNSLLTLRKAGWKLKQFKET